LQLLPTAEAIPPCPPKRQASVQREGLSRCFAAAKFTCGSCAIQSKSHGEVSISSLSNNEMSTLLLVKSANCEHYTVNWYERVTNS